MVQGQKGQLWPGGFKGFDECRCPRAEARGGAGGNGGRVGVKGRGGGAGSAPHPGLYLSKTGPSAQYTGHTCFGHLPHPPKCAQVSLTLLDKPRPGCLLERG